MLCVTGYLNPYLTFWQFSLPPLLIVTGLKLSDCLVLFLFNRISKFSRRVYVIVTHTLQIGNNVVFFCR